MESAFNDLYKKLNQGQKEAVDTIEGPVMVIAGPGTGKTTVLTLRIANILKQTDTPPSGILALTFTEAGVKAMRMKLREIIGARANDVRIHTFHGFAASIISQYSDHFPHLQGEQMTEIDAENLVRDILTEKDFWKLRPAGDPEYYVGKIISTISSAKREAWTPEMIEEFARSEIERLKQDPESISTRGKSKGELKGVTLDRIEKCEKTTLFARVYDLYEQRKRASKLLDFDDLIFELLQALKNDEILLRSIQEQFLYILIDEHQDTNDAQNAIIKIIADFFDTPNLFIVGDEKQAIYRFQGASVENFLKFQKLWGTMRLIALQTNYRSHQSILDASFAMIDNNYDEDEHKDLRIKLAAEKTRTERPIEVLVAEGGQSETLSLVEKIKGIMEQDSQATVAIIVRKNANIAEFAQELDQAGLEYSAEEGSEVFESSLGQLFFSLAEFFIDPAKIEHLATGIATSLWKLDFSERVEILQAIRSSQIERLDQKIPELKNLLKYLETEAPLAFLSLLAEHSGLLHLTLSSPKQMQIWRDIYSLAVSLCKQKSIESPKRLLEEMQAFRKSAGKRVIKFKKGDPSAKICVITAHGSKGLEFDYVFLPKSTEENWAIRSRHDAFVLPENKTNEDFIKDERRLFYVGLTRARKHVVISYSETSELGKPFTRLRFIDELASDHLLEVRAPELERALDGRAQTKRAANHQKELLDFMKISLLEKGLSVTALNHFLECPNKFIYKSILKVPEPPSPHSEKGNAMHEAMNQIWRQRQAGKNLDTQTIEKMIVEAAQNYFKKSLLAKNEKLPAVEELTKNAKLVAKALIEHFSWPGEIKSETWFEAPFEFKYQDKTMEVRLHGKLDALLIDQKSVKVFDYKTKEGMSERAIRGETENEDGGYLRQLIFYKILIDNDPNLQHKNQEFALAFIKPNKSGACPIVSLSVSDAEVLDLKEKIASLFESVWSGSILSAHCPDPKCEFCNLSKLHHT